MTDSPAENGKQVFIQECLSFITETVKQLKTCSVHERDWYLNSVRKISDRAEDPYLNVAVIGDFSSGKSTFINALIGKNLLKTAWLATTAVPTRICCRGGGRTEVEAEMTDGTVCRLSSQRQREAFERRIRESLPRDLEDLIAHLTTSNRLANRLKGVTIRTPGNRRFSNICIIDTPGVNPGAKGTEEHVKATQKVLREYADATIILFKANQVYTDSFGRFLEENAGHFLDEAVFVVTMLDIVAQEERDEILEYIRSRLQEKFGLREPKIYGCSAKYANYVGDDAGVKAWSDEFDILRDETIRRMEARRLIIIQRQLERLLAELLAELDRELSGHTERLQKELAVLESNSIRRLEGELQNNYEKYSRIVEETYKGLLPSLKEKYLKMFHNIQVRADAGINGCRMLWGSGWDTISGYMKEGFPKVAEDEQARLSSAVAEDLKALYDCREAYYEENRALFLRYEMALQEESGAFGREEAGVLSGQELTINGVTGVGGVQAALEAVGALAMVPVLLPLAILDGFLGTGMADFAGSIFGGIVNFIGALGVLQRNKEKAIAELHVKLETARKENEGAFFEQTETAKNSVLASMQEISRLFLDEYGKAYQTRSQESAEEQERIRRELKQSRGTQRRIRKYQNRIAQERRDQYAD